MKILAILLLTTSVALAGEVNYVPKVHKGDFASHDVNEICAGKGKYRNFPHTGGTYSRNHRLTQNEEVKRQVMEQSGVDWSERAKYEDDHYAPLCLGGSDSIKNRWAQPRFGEWPASMKDKIEAKACELVCDGEVDLETAQSWFDTDKTPDWRDVYKQLIHE